MPRGGRHGGGGCLSKNIRENTKTPGAVLAQRPGSSLLPKGEGSNRFSAFLPGSAHGKNQYAIWVVRFITGIRNTVSSAAIRLIWPYPDRACFEFDFLSAQLEGSETCWSHAYFMKVTLIDLPRLHELILELGIIASHVGSVGCDARLVKL